MKKSAYSLACMLIMLSCTNEKKQTYTADLKKIEVKYPETKKDTTIKDNYFGTTVSDPYRWLENDTSAETTAWVRNENEVTQNYLSQIPFREEIKNRYKDLFNYEKYSAPFKQGKYTYYYKNSGLQNQSVLYRELPANKDAEVFLDPNTFSKDGTTSLAGIAFSKDGSMAAYNISEGGSDWQKLVVIDAANKKQTGDTLELKFSGASWKGNDGFYYSSYQRPSSGNVLSAKNENHKLYYHKVGTPQSTDKMVYGDDKHPVRYMGGYVSEDEKWLIIQTANETYGNTLYVQDLTKPNAPVIALATDMKNTYYIIDVDDQNFYIQTDKDAPTSKIVIAPIADPAQPNWKSFVDAKPEVLTTSSAGGYIFCSYLKDALTKVYQYDKTGKQVREVQLPGLGTADGFGAKKEEKELYFVFTSYTNPATIYKLNIESGVSEIYKQSKVQFKPEDYESKQIFYTSKDGTKIPMIITYKKGIELNGNNPCLLYGYGGFSVSITPYFSTSSIILLENGGVYAVPNIRGGGEYGEEWHQQGIKTKKQNVFDDFMAAAQYLIDNKYTSKDKLAIEGGSNGGLLIGACITQKPDMCKVAFPEVGVMDMLRYHKFTAGAGWAYDYGTSEDSKEMFEYIYHYSPVHNIKTAAYPATMVTTADHDDRVVPAHSFKFGATMQEKNNGSNPVIIRIETKAGHGAGQSTEQIIEQQTDKWSFMFYNMGLLPHYNN
jgi:prolyl oligopeptidase